MTEWVDIWTKDGKPTGNKILKSQAHALGYYHPTIHLWIFNSKGEVLLQKRASAKKTFPGKWDVSVAGHITAGDSPEETVIREAREELGLTVKPGDAEFIGVRSSDIRHSEKLIDREHHHIYLLRKDLDTGHLKLQQEEVADVSWISADRLKKYQGDPNSFPDLVPFEPEYFRYVTEQLYARF